VAQRSAGDRHDGLLTAAFATFCITLAAIDVTHVMMAFAADFGLS
jgi:hypothetical protein